MSSVKRAFLGCGRGYVIHDLQRGNVPSNWHCRQWLLACRVQRPAAENALAVCMSSPGSPRYTATAHHCHEPSSPMHSIPNDQHQCDSICTGLETTSYLRLVERTRPNDGAST